MNEVFVLIAVLAWFAIFLFKVKYAIDEDLFLIFDNGLLAIIFIYAFAFVPGTLVLHVAFYRVIDLFKRRAAKFREVENTYRWYVEHA